MFGAFYVG